MPQVVDESLEFRDTDRGRETRRRTLNPHLRERERQCRGVGGAVLPLRCCHERDEIHTPAGQEEQVDVVTDLRSSEDRAQLVRCDVLEGIDRQAVRKDQRLADRRGAIDDEVDRHLGGAVGHDERRNPGPAYPGVRLRPSPVITRWNPLTIPSNEAGSLVNSSRSTDWRWPRYTAPSAVPPERETPSSPRATASRIRC